jgi:hypothetical protein
MVVLRDTVIFVLGVLIIARQAGIFFAPPSSVSIELLTVGALMCNVPGILHVIAWRTGGIAPPSSSPAPSQRAPQSGQSHASSSGGDA